MAPDLKGRVAIIFGHTPQRLVYVFDEPISRSGYWLSLTE